MKLIHLAKFVSPALLIFKCLTTASAQGTITFNNPWINDGVSGFVLGYHDGFSFRVGDRTPPFEYPAKIGAVGPAGYLHNGTPYYAFINTLGTPQSTIFARTNAATFGDHTFTAGAPFGLLSVDLADPVAPSLTPIDITFNGYRADNSVVSQTFTVGGGGSTTFQTFTFNSDFAFGLVRVEIPSPAWAMDNLVWIPEPSTAGLFLIGLLALAAKRGSARRWLS